MGSERLFFCSLVVFACGWAAVAFLYFLKVIPAVRKKRGWRTIFEAGLQLNFAGRVREYGSLAKHENNRGMLGIFYLLNVLVVLSVAAFLIGVLATIEF